MIVLDANLPIYAFNEGSPQNVAARAWFESAMNDDEMIGFPLVTLIAFIRITTNPRLFEFAMPAEEAVGIVAGWLERPNVRLISPSDRHWRIFGEVALAGQVRGQDMTDAHIAALTMEHGATLVTNDRGFARFPKLKVRYPLAP